MIILEVKDGSTGVNVDNGALLNYNAVDKQDGRLCGFSLSIDSDMNLIATAGTLMVHGIRLQVRATETITAKIASYQPTDSTALQCVNLVLSYDSKERTTSFTFGCEKADVAHENPSIEEDITGTIYYRLATFIKANGAVTGFTDCVKDVTYNPDAIIEGFYKAGNGQFYKDSSFTTIIEGETSKIYVDLPNNKIYRYRDGSYTLLSASLALGETSSTAYSGDKGKKNADAIASLETSVSSNTNSIVDIISGDIQVSDASNADVATRLLTPRNISLSGDINGSTTFDGSKDVTINTTLSDSGVNEGTYSVVEVNTKGLVTSGGQLIEVATSTSSTASSSLVIGGLFFKMIS